MSSRRVALWSAVGGAAAAVAAVWGANAVAGGQKEYKSGIVWPEPKLVAPGAKDSDPPADAVVLFDGKDLSKWNGGENWPIKDGVATSAKSGTPRSASRMASKASAVPIATATADGAFPREPK